MLTSAPNVTTYDGTAIDTKYRKEFQIRKKEWNLLIFATFKGLLKKSAFLKIAAQAFNFLNIFLMVQSCKLCNNKIYDFFSTNNKHWKFGIEP